MARESTTEVSASFWGRGSPFSLVARRRNLGTFDVEAGLSVTGSRMPQALEVCIRTCKSDNHPIAFSKCNFLTGQQEFLFVKFHGPRQLFRSSEGPGRRSQSALHGGVGGFRLPAAVDGILEVQSVPIAQASAGTSSGSRAPALRPTPNKRPRRSRLTVEINTAGFSKLYNVAPRKNLPKHRSLDKYSTHCDWCNAFGNVGHSS